MRRSIRDTEEALEGELCGLCAERPADGKCHLAARGECSVHARLHLVATAIHTASNGSLGQIFRAIREQLCSTCPRRAPDGACIFRNQVADAMVIEALLRPPMLSSAVLNTGTAPVSGAVERAINQVGRHG
jgi:hypothetical protein